MKGRDTQEKQENSATCALFFVINFFLLRGHIMDIIQLQLHHEQPFVRIYSKELKTKPTDTISTQDTYLETPSLSS